jgi:hypothetical protein
MPIKTMNMALYDLLKRVPTATEAEAREAASLDDLASMKRDLAVIKSTLVIQTGLTIGIFWLLWNLSRLPQ